tara:strand:- start:74 stop:421 length:348 start_codon:yes stop_codon:yes gene_type:complete
MLKGKKIIYWTYAFWVFVYAIVFLSIGITIGKTLEKYMPKLDEKKYRLLTLLEIYLQVGLVAVLTYIMREYVEAIFKIFFNIQKQPGKFSALIIAPTLFSQMPTLMNKLHHIWDI